jgi:RNA polymerase sigma-70 factor (ECF subfamily)
MPQAAAQYSVAELELADRARSGDQTALVELYQRYRKPLYRHAWRMLRNECAAQDVVQEAFTRAIEAMPRTRAELKFKAWIFRIATNLCLRRLNRGGRLVFDSGSSQQRQAAGPGTDPEQGRRRAEIAGYVAAALEQMPPHYRQILLLRELEELSYEELAQTLESETNRIKVTLHRARARFAAHFITEQLLASSEVDSVRCDDLAALLQVAEPDRAGIVKHLETCPVCRKRERRPAAELFGLLPPMTDLPAGLDQPPALGAPAGASTAAASTGWGLALTLLATGAMVAALVFVARPIRRVQERSTPPPLAVAAENRPVLASPGAGTNPQPPLGAQHPTPQPPPTKPPLVHSAPRKAQATTSARPSDGGTSTAKRPGLRIKLRFTRGTVQVHRGGGGAFALVDADQLRLGDLLQTLGGSTVGLRLPGSQWITVRGRLRLDDVPARGDPTSRVRVTLIEGSLRARATTPGRGLEIAALDSRCRCDGGELRVRRSGADLLVESLDAVVTVSGSHATRKMTPSSRLVIGSQPGFAHGLLPAASRLRPVTSRATHPPLLSWAAVPSARSYRVQIARDTDFMQVLQTHQVATRQVRPDTLSAGKYFWQVVASDGRFLGRPSKIYSFTID